VFFLKQKPDTSITLGAFFNYIERQFSTKIKQIYSNNSSKYISNELKNIFLTSGVIHKLIPPYSLKSNSIVEHFYQIINTIVDAMTIAAPDFLCL
jgi:transposase InsO family protein